MPVAGTVIDAERSKATGAPVTRGEVSLETTPGDEMAVKSASPAVLRRHRGGKHGICGEGCSRAPMTYNGEFPIRTARQRGSPEVMVTIRLSRGGAKKQPFYHIVATDSRARRDGRYIERLGYYNPVARGAATAAELDLERLDYWVSVGAQMSERVTQIAKGYRKEQAAAA